MEDDMTGRPSKPNRRWYLDFVVPVLVILTVFAILNLVVVIE